MIFVRENFGLIREVAAATIDQINTGQAVLARNLLGARLFFTGHRVISAAFDRCVITDNHDLAARDASNTRNQPSARNIVIITLIGGEL